MKQTTDRRTAKNKQKNRRTSPTAEPKKYTVKTQKTDLKNHKNKPDEKVN